MRALFEEVGGSQSKAIDGTDLAKRLGLSPMDTRNITDYLKGQGLLMVYWTGDRRAKVSLTYDGIVEVEESIEHPDRETEHFPPASNIIVINEMHHSQVQQGTHGSYQHGQFTSDERALIQEFVAEFRDRLDELGLSASDEAEARADIDTVETQMSSPRPKQAIVREALRSVRNILENMAASGAASGLLELVQRIT